MALIGSISTVRAQLAQTPAFKTAFAYLEEVFREGSEVNRRMAELKAGDCNRFELENGAFVMEQAYEGKARSAARWESHRAYIDVQVIFSGEERIELSDVKNLTVDEDKTPGQDAILYKEFDKTSVLRVDAGEAAVFFPVDGHLPSQAVNDKAPSLIRKTVVKVPVGK